MYLIFRQETIHAYGNVLIEIWQKSFGAKHVMTRRSVEMKLKRVAKDYYNKVHNKGK